MAKKKTATPKLISEAKLEALRAEAERLGRELGYSFHEFCPLPFYRPLVFYVMFTHLLDTLRAKLGRISDATATANAFFWYSVVFEYSHQIEPGFNPLAEEKDMEYIEGAPSLYFSEADYLALIEAAEQYVAARPLTSAQKTAARKARFW